MTSGVRLDGDVWTDGRPSYEEFLAEKAARPAASGVEPGGLHALRRAATWAGTEG